MTSPSRSEVHVPDKLSYSSFSSFVQCGERWRLERGLGTDTPTWWATLAGSVLHAATEAYDVSVEIDEQLHPDLEEYSERAFLEALVLEKEAHDEKRGTEVKASGETLEKMSWRGGPNKKDVEWWGHYGPLIFAQWLAFREDSPLEILHHPSFPDGVGVEVPFELETKAGISVRGYIDRVFQDPETGHIVVVDLKTGKTPGSDLQVATYAYALRQQYGLSADWGGYWYCVQPRGKAGTVEWRLTQADMTLFSDEFIESLYDRQAHAMREGLFLPNPTSMCRGCGVAELCRAVGGRRSQQVPIDAPVKHVEAEVRV